MKYGFVVLAALSFLFEKQVFAAPPSNDLIGGATTVSIGFEETINTTEATTDAEGTFLNVEGFCFSATDASVWYKYTSNSDIYVGIDATESSYSVGLIVAEGSLDSLNFTSCGWQTGGFYAYADTTYYVVAVDPQFDGEGNGGTLKIKFIEPEPLSLTAMTIDPKGTVIAKNGVATVSGTYSCIGSDASYIDINVRGQQRLGRLTGVVSSGYGFAFYDNTCDGTEKSWTAEIFPYSGKFNGKQLFTLYNAFAYDQYNQGSSFYGTRMVNLVRRPRI